MEENIDYNNLSPEEILELQKKNCLFCQIVEKKIPSKIVYEDDKVICVLDIQPSNIGHTIIIPKEHYQIIPQIPDSIVKHMFKIAKHISHSILKSFSNEGVNGTNIFLANGYIAGQKAPHLIMHVIPRTDNDKFLKFEKKSLEENKILEYKNKISEKLNYNQNTQTQTSQIQTQKTTQQITNTNNIQNTNNNKTSTDDVDIDNLDLEELL